MPLRSSAAWRHVRERETTLELTHEILRLRLSEPFATARTTRDTIRQVVVRVDDGTHSGTGTAVLGDDGATRSLAAYARMLARVERPEAALDRIEAEPGPPAIRSAVDMALHDLLGRVSGQPLHRLWGLDAGDVGVTAVSLGVHPPDELVERARRLAAEGWPILKLKLTPAHGATLVARVREVFRGRLWVDGNGAWEVPEAVDAARSFRLHGVELFEQPLPPGDPDSLRHVRSRSGLAIAADEDCAGPGDVERLRGCVDVVNVKLGKCGGLRRAHETIRAARRAGIGVMIGCRSESVLGVTAAAQLAPLADHLDLDGHLDVLDDPFSGLGIQAGRLTLPAGPGHGVQRR